jgi:hypothetical protein
MCRTGVPIGRTRPPADHVFVRTTGSKAAAAARIEAGHAVRARAELLRRLRSCFARTQTWQHAGRYLSALVSEIPKRNGWTIAEQVGDRTPDRTQRLLNRAAWDTLGAMSQVRRFAARRSGRRGEPSAAAWAGDRGVGRDWPGQGGHRDVRGEAAVHGVCGPCRERDQHGPPVVCAPADRARVDRRASVDPGRADQRSADRGRDGAAAGAGVSHQGPVGHRHLRRRLRRWPGVRLRLRGRGVRQLHRVAGVLRAARAGIRAAGGLHLHGS